MASRLADSKALARRCEKAGWTVEESGDGWKVDTGSQPFVIHRSYSDVRSLTNATATLERLGLLDAEEAAREATASKRRQTAREIKEREAKALAGAQDLANRNTELRVKAAGPYMIETEEVGYEWFAAPHPAPWVRRVWVTPELAKKILDNLNVDNRPKGDLTVEHYRNIVLSDQWLLTHQGVAFDTRGILQDAQHRFWAVYEAGKVCPDIRVPMFVWVGMPVENFKAIDEGKLRTAAQLFGKGGEKNGSTLQAMIRLILAYRADDGNVRRQYRLKTTNAEVLACFETDKDLMRECAAKANTHARKLKVSAMALATAMYLIRSANQPRNRYVDLFFQGLITDKKPNTRYVLEDVDPRKVLRLELARIAEHPKNRRPGVDLVALFILSWNNIVLERSPKWLRFDADAQPPQVLICDDTTSATPATLNGETEEMHAAA